MAVVGAVVVGYYLAVASDAHGGGAAGAHGDEVEGEVAGADAVDVDQPEHELEVGGEADACVEVTVAFEADAATVE